MRQAGAAIDAGRSVSTAQPSGHRVAADWPRIISVSTTAQQRRYRARLKADRAVLLVEVDEFGLADALIEMAESEDTSEDRTALALAAGSLLRDWARLSKLLQRDPLFGGIVTASKPTR